MLALSRWVYFIRNCAGMPNTRLTLFSLLELPLSVLTVVEISAAPTTKKTAKIKEAPRRLIDLTVFTFIARQVKTLPMINSFTRKK